MTKSTLTPTKEKKIVKIERVSTPEGVFEIELVEKSRKKITTEELFEQEIAEILKGIRNNQNFNSDIRFNFEPERAFAHYFLEWLKIRPKDYDERLSELLKFVWEEVGGHKITE